MGGNLYLSDGFTPFTLAKFGPLLEFWLWLIPQ